MTTIADQTMDDVAPVLEGETVNFHSRGANFKAVITPSYRRIHDHGAEFIAGTYADFAPNGHFSTDDPDVIAHLRSLPSLGLEFFELAAPMPEPDDVLEAIMLATIELDDAQLAEIEAVERTGFNRAGVLQAASAARQQVQKLEAQQVAAQQEAGD